MVLDVECLGVVLSDEPVVLGDCAYGARHDYACAVLSAFEASELDAVATPPDTLFVELDQAIDCCGVLLLVPLAVAGDDSVLLFLVVCESCRWWERDVETLEGDVRPAILSRLVELECAVEVVTELLLYEALLLM